MVKKQLEQELYFDCNRFKNKTMVCKWIKAKGYKMPKCKDPIKEYKRGSMKRYVVKQRDKCLFRKAMCCKYLEKGVKAVVGKLK